MGFCTQIWCLTNCESGRARVWFPIFPVCTGPTDNHRQYKQFVTLTDTSFLNTEMSRFIAVSPATSHLHIRTNVK